MTQIITNNGGGGSGVGVYKYKGSVNTYEDLPSSGMKIGDVYNVVNEHTTAPKFPAGSNLAWTGTEWDVLGGTIDLDDYQKKLVEGAGIDIDGDTNEISVESTVINGATAGATALQPGDDVSDLNNDAGYITSSDIPTDVSAFNNDAGYLVSSDLKQSDWGQTDSSKIDYIKNKPTIGNATLTIQKNGTTVNSITMNSTSNVTANISVPTNVSDLSNDSGFITKDVNDLTNYTKTSDLGAVALSNNYTDLNNQPDLSGYQTTANLVTDLNNADNTHYPSAKAVSDAIIASGGGDMLKSVYDPNNVAANAFDYTNFINTPTIPSVIDALNSTSTTDALSANQGYVLDGKISTINGKIPSEASTSNKLADKNYVDDSINSITAYYITKNAQGDQFATKAELNAATTFYSGGVVRVPTRNDYCIVASDETHDNSVVRYIYQNGQWEYQYTVNETPLTQAQLDALNSGITSGKVSSYDGVVSTIAGYGNIVTHNASEFATSAQGTKADTALQPNDNISELNNDSGYITGVDWGDIGGTLSNQVDLNNALTAKANDDAVVKLTGAQTIAGTKTFSTSPVVPSKTADATNTGTAIATEAQVYKKQDTLVSGTNIKTINNTSLLGSGNIDIQSGGNYTAGNGIDITNDEIGLDGTYSAVESDMQGPAPTGYHVPTKDEWVALCGILTTTFSMASNATTMGTYLKMPMAGYRIYDTAAVTAVGGYGRYWSSIPHDNDKAYYLLFTSSAILPQGDSYYTSGSSIRCFKNSPTIPTSSWATLYDGSSIATGAGVFYNATDGLISVSGDGQTWYTIMDKNLGATTVYNQGYTLTDANCGYFYQWGNNYGFPHSGTVTTSRTKVNAQNYGPGNYYSSNKFISNYYNWDSSINQNLRGGVSQGTYAGANGNLIIGDKLYKIVTSTTAPSSGTASNIITFVTE